MAYAAFNGWWLLAFRHGMPLDADEAGYLSASFVMHDGLVQRGVMGLWETVQTTSGFGPLTPLATVPIHLAFGNSVIMGFFVQLLFVGGLIYGVYLMSRDVLSLRGTMVAVLATLAAPGFIDFVRTYQFAVGAAAMYAISIGALVASRGLTRWRWSAVAGMALGASLLARTMMVSFVPAVAVAALVPVVFGDRRPLRAANYVVAMVSALAVASTWYAHNWRYVYDYLTSFGYGSKSVYYGDAHPPWSWSYWTTELHGFVTTIAFAPLATVLLVIFVAGLVQRVRTRRERSSRGWRATWMLAPLTPVVIVLALDYAVLTTSRNNGAGFAIPLLPLVIVLATAVLWRLGGRTRAGLTVALVVVSSFAFLETSGTSATASKLRHVDVRILDPVTLTDGRGHLARFLDASGYPVAETGELPAMHEEWFDASVEAARFMTSYAGARAEPLAPAFGSREPLFTTSTVRLAGLRELHVSFGSTQVDSSYAGDTVEGYRKWLDGPLSGDPNMIVTGDEPPRSFDPHVTQSRVERAALDAGFKLVHELQLPDGRDARFYWRPR